MLLTNLDKYIRFFKNGQPVTKQWAAVQENIVNNQMQHRNPDRIGQNSIKPPPACMSVISLKQHNSTRNSDFLIFLDFLLLWNTLYSLGFVYA